MKPIDEDHRNRFFTEMAIALKREGLEAMPLEYGLLTVLMDGHPICQISGGGSVRYRLEEYYRDFGARHTKSYGYRRNSFGVYAPHGTCPYSQSRRARRELLR